MILSVCSHCKSQKVRECNRERVSNRLRNALPSDIGFQEVRCLAACDRPIAVGISANAKTSYLFGDIKNEEDVCGLLEFIEQYRKSSNGWSNSSERPKSLRTKIVARVPLSFLTKFKTTGLE